MTKRRVFEIVDKFFRNSLTGYEFPGGMPVSLLQDVPCDGDDDLETETVF